MKRVILGTAGHIDHGKTELIRALTGIETDRLKEEKSRGISIELGFAFLELAEDIRMGIVDVPGHERFVRQMVAGSGGIDIAALVIALDEGVMPQTVEHLDILSLLNVRLGVIVLTKLDLVDEELALLAEEDAGDLVKGTFLEEAPMVQVSSKTGAGLDELRAVLTDLARRLEDRPAQGLLRLPVDRVFTLRGHGTVVTGTLLSGAVSVGDEIEVLPSGKRSSVRSLQSHKRQEETALPGERVAVNLRGLEQSDLERGEILTHPNHFTPSHIIDVRLSTLVHSPLALKNRQRVRLHHYTTEVEARLVFPDVEQLEPGESAPAQLRTAAPIVPAAGDRFVVRALSPSVTLGGGVVINPRGIKLKARSAELFTRLDEQDDPGIVEALVKSAGLRGATKKELVGLSGLPPKRLDKVLEKLKSAQTLIRIDQAEDRLIHAYYLDILHNRVVRRLEKFHVEQPLKEGMPKQQLRSHVPGSDKLFRRLMEILTGQKVVVDLGDAVRAPLHTVHLKEEEEDVKESLRHAIIQGHASPPTFKALVAQSGGDAKQVRTLLGLLERDNLVVKAKEDLYFSRAFIDEIKAKLTAFITEHGGITPSQFNELTRSSRKYNIPLLEYLDRERFTMRVGDQRVLRGSATSAGGGRAE